MKLWIALSAPIAVLVFVLMSSSGKPPFLTVPYNAIKPNVNLIWVHLTGARVNVPNKEIEEWDIRETTFRYQFPKALILNDTRMNDAYYLGLDSGSGHGLADPPDEFMGRFTGNTPPVKRISECDETLHNGVVDKKTGGGGLIFTSGDIRWVTPTDVEVSGAIWAGSTGGCWLTYYLRKVDGRWMVVDQAVNMTS